MSPPLVTRCVGILLTLTVLTAPPSYAVAIGSASVAPKITPPVVVHQPAAPRSPPIITNEQLHKAYDSTLLNTTLVPLLKHCAHNEDSNRWCAAYIESVRAYHKRVTTQESTGVIVVSPDMPAIQLAIEANEKLYKKLTEFCANWPANITLTEDGTATGKPKPCMEFCDMFDTEYDEIVIPVCHRIVVMNTLPLSRATDAQSGAPAAQEAPSPPASGHIAVVKLARTDESVVPKVIAVEHSAAAAPAPVAAVSPHPTKGISASTTSATTPGKRAPSIAHSPQNAPPPNEASQPKDQPQQQPPIASAEIVMKPADAIDLPGQKPPTQEHEQPPPPQQEQQPQQPDHMDVITDTPAVDAAAAAAAAAVDAALASDSLIPPAIGDVGDDIDDLEAEDEAEEAAAAEAERKQVTAAGSSSVGGFAGAEPTVQRDPFVGDEESSFFSYFMFVLVVCVAAYVLHHNRRLLLALLLEGRRRNGTGVGRRKHTAAYRKLDSNLEEAISASSSAAAGAGTSCAEAGGGGRSQSVIY